ncbi:hypothetical protein RA272_30640, partial [Pseudomonas syringae pv. tagetis]
MFFIENFAGAVALFHCTRNACNSPASAQQRPLHQLSSPFYPATSKAGKNSLNTTARHSTKCAR